MKGVADEHVTGESWKGTFKMLKNTLAPKLIGENPMNMERIHELMDAEIYGVPTAKAAIDIACYDAQEKHLVSLFIIFLEADIMKSFRLRMC